MVSDCNFSAKILLVLVLDLNGHATLRVHYYLNSHTATHTCAHIVPGASCRQGEAHSLNVPPNSSHFAAVNPSHSLNREVLLPFPQGIRVSYSGVTG